MRVMYCERYGKYVSQKHCEFFNDGRVGCSYYHSANWDSIRNLLRDHKRPKKEIGAIKKPFKCNFFEEGQNGG